MTYTPGALSYFDGGLNGFAIRDEATPERIATVYYAPMRDGKSDGWAEAEERAKLFAASPGLLEALKEIAEIMKVRQCGCYRCDEAVKKAREAIALAQEGKPNG